MKDKRLDALLETFATRLPGLFTYLNCPYYQTSWKDNQATALTQEDFCLMPNQSPAYNPTSCQGDIRKCEREE